MQEVNQIIAKFTPGLYYLVKTIKFNTFSAEDLWTTTLYVFFLTETKQ